MRIQKRQHDAFEHDGFVLIKPFLSGLELKDVIANVDRFVHDVVPGLPGEHVFYEDRSDARSLKQIQNLGDHDPWFEQLFRDSVFRTVAEQFLNGPVIPKNLQYFNKPATVGQATPPHQDGYYFMLEPCEAVTMWFALDDVDAENGCVRYVKGSHHAGMRPHVRTQTLGFSQGIVDYPNESDRQNEVAIPAEPGDLLIHHAMTIHRADGNRSLHRSRRSLGLVYYSERAREDAQAQAAYQQKLAAELKASGRI